MGWAWRPKVEDEMPDDVAAAFYIALAWIVGFAVGVMLLPGWL